jgi:molybdopterin synthase sulfur carrier subunit
MITVLFFGPVAERVGKSRLEVAYQAGMRLQDLRDQLQAGYPEAFALVSIAAVNGNHERDLSVALADHSEVVFMSKFSGG